MPEIQDTRGANVEVYVENLLKANQAIAIATDAMGRVRGPGDAICIELDEIRERIHRLRVKGSKKEIEEGTVVEGTMRTEELIYAFKSELAQHALAGALEIGDYYRNVFDWMRDHGGELHGAPASLLDAAERCREELYDRLDELAPEGMYFGAHPGNGSDFGYWKIEEEEK